MRFLVPAFLVFLVLPLAGGCATASFGTQAASPLPETSYAAADRLIQQARTLVTPDTPVTAGTLADMDNPGEQTAFGRLVAEQVAARFVQLGYSNVSSAPLPGAAGGGMMDDAAAPPYYGTGASSAGAPVMITGQYARARQAVLVNLRLTETGTGRALAAYDYSLPLDPDVKELIRTQADKKSFFGF